MSVRLVANGHAHPKELKHGRDSLTYTPICLNARFDGSKKGEWLGSGRFSFNYLSLVQRITCLESTFLCTFLSPMTTYIGRSKDNIDMEWDAQINKDFH